MFGASCGLEIPKQGEFLVFATKPTSAFGPRPAVGQLYAGLCGGTRSTEEGLLAPEIATPRPLASGPGPSGSTEEARARPQSTSSPSGLWIVAGIAALVVFAFAVLAMGWRRRSAGKTE